MNELLKVKDIQARLGIGRSAVYALIHEPSFLAPISHHPLLPPPLLTNLLVPDHSLYLAGREWSGTEIAILSERLQYLVTRRRRQ